MEHSHDAVIALAQAIGKATFGDWGATGYEIKVVLVRAAEAALEALDDNGYDLTLLDATDAAKPPKGYVNPPTKWDSN